MHNLYYNNIQRKGMKWFVFFGLIFFGLLLVHIVGINSLSNLPSSGYIWPIIFGVFIGGIAVGHAWMLLSFGSHRSNATQVNDPDVISPNGLHWHPYLAIYVKGVKQEIPHIRLTDMEMSTMHSGKEEEGIIHLKFKGMVRKSDITLGLLFKQWGKDIHSLGTNLKMTVNGQENTEFENYVMQDKDKIELRYE